MLVIAVALFVCGGLAMAAGRLRRFSRLIRFGYVVVALGAVATAVFAAGAGVHTHGIQVSGR